MFWPEKTMCPRWVSMWKVYFKKLERRDSSSSLIPSFLISLSRLLRLGIFVSGHQSNIYEITSLDLMFWPEKTMVPGTRSWSNNFFKKLERRDSSSLIPSFLISQERLLRLGKFFSCHAMYLGVFNYPPSILFDLKQGHTPRQKCQSLPSIWS